jgi:hypothetical protein
MSRFFAVTTALIVLGMGLGLAAPVGAQANETATGNATAPVAEFDNGATISEYSFEDGTVTVTISTERPTEVTISDALAGIGKEGATTVPKESQRVLPGTETVTMPVTSFRGGNSVSVSIDGQTARLSSEFDADDGENPFQYFGGTSGLLSGMAVAVAMALSAAGFALWREDNGVRKA